MLLIALIAAAVVSASPVDLQARTAVLPLKHVNSITSVKNLVDRGHARLNKVNGVSTASVTEASSGAVTNEDVSYVAPVSIGGSTYQLIVDTGCMLPLLKSA
jgi:hypothetical protein